MKEIKVLGPGCSKCKKLADNVSKAIEQLPDEPDFEYVTDMQKIIEAGIMMTPALIIDGKVVSTGKALPVKDIVKLFNS